MPTKLFASMGFTICASVFIVLVFVMYLSKKKFRAFENNIFLFMFILTFILLINEFLYIYAMYAELDGNINFLSTRPLCYTYIFGCILWLACLVLYIWAIGKQNSTYENLNRSKRKMFVFLTFLVVAMFTASCILPIEYPTSNSNLYVFSGPAVYTVYIIGIAVLIMVIISVISRGASIPSEQKNPIYFCLLILVIINSIQLIYDLDYNSLTFLYTFVITTLYFTIESQDYKLMDNLEKKRVESVIADKAQTEFLTNMSHEIRTPLNTILGFSDSLLSERKLSKDLVLRDVEMMHSASVNLLELINNILDISRLESGKEKVDEKEYKIQNLINEIENKGIQKFKDEDVEFSINVDKNIPSEYRGDFQKIIKIISCLLNNAKKNTTYGKVSVNVSGKIIEKDLFELTFTILSTGHEMSYEKFNISFNDFVKLGTGSQNSIDSSALDLLISKRLLSLLDGEILYNDEDEDKTKYIIKIKQKIINDSKVGNLSKLKIKQALKKIDCSNKKVLVVDDNDLNIKLATRLLSEYNFDIDTAQSGKECIEKVKNTKYDIIFLDHMMFDMDGVETLNILKNKIKDLPPVIALTANSATGLKEKYIKLGFYEYLSKPIDIVDLNKIINQIFEEK